MLRDKWWPGAAARIIDEPVPVDVVELGRPDVRLIPARCRCRPDADAVRRYGRQPSGLVNPDRIVVRLGEVIRVAAPHHPRVLTGAEWIAKGACIRAARRRSSARSAAIGRGA